MQLIFSLCLWTKTQWQGTSRCRQEFIPFPNDIFRLQMSLLPFQSLDLTFLFLNFVQLILFGRTSIFPFSSILFCMDCFIVENVLFLFEPLRAALPVVILSLFNHICEGVIIELLDSMCRDCTDKQYMITSKSFNLQLLNLLIPCAVVPMVG